MQDFEALTPNLLARTVETVEGGGLVIMLVSNLTSLTQVGGYLGGGALTSLTQVGGQMGGTAGARAGAGAGAGAGTVGEC